MDALLRPWVDVLGRQPAAVEEGRQLLERYVEPHRHYHDRRHLSEVLTALRTLSGPAVPVPVLLAAYWHDAVYDPTRIDNEDRSAALATVVLRRLGLPPGTVDEVARLVALTATHDPSADDEAGALLCDADLAVLAAPADRYRDYASAVRREYAHLDDVTFRSGRAAVLRGLADRPRLFTTDQALSRWDAPARRNLREELFALDAVPPP